MLMKHLTILLLIYFSIQSCQDNGQVSSIHPVNWDSRTLKHSLSDSLSTGSTYLSVYSQIYSESEHRTHDLTVTVSMRNTNTTDTIFINKADYFNTKGHSIRTYFNRPIYIAPMETVEIVIDEKDQEGGTGANFLFDWTINPNTHEPLFESVMISTSGQQGISFTTQGKRIE